MPRMAYEKDYYRILGLHPEAPEAEIRAAYRRLALQWHPDRNPGNPQATERFQEISEAYAVLIEPTRRRQYDAAQRAGASAEFRVRREDLFRDLFADPRASMIFEEIAREFEQLGMRVDRRYFHETLFGGRTVVTGGVFIVTPFTPVRALFRLGRAALGGWRQGEPVEVPETRAGRPGILRGLGRVGRWLVGLPPAPGSPLALGPADLLLPLCLTRAEAERGGPRRVTLKDEGRPSDVLVRIPAGVRAGTRLRLRGKGRRGPGGQGDLYLAVEIRD